MELAMLASVVECPLDGEGFDASEALCAFERKSELACRPCLPAKLVRPLGLVSAACWLPMLSGNLLSKLGSLAVPPL